MTITLRPHASVIACSLLALLLAPACKGDDGNADSDAGTDDNGDGDGDGDGGDGDGDSGDGAGDPELETFSLTHRFGELTLTPFEESLPCVQWTLDNDAALYVQQVTLANLGYTHHSNWFVVPEQLYAGDDGYFNCSERGVNELGAATTGTVLYAQSTQSFVEQQATGAGAVIKIPPRHKVIADLHMLNVGPDTVTTDMFMTLDLIHPKDVQVVLTPFRLTYLDLDIPANSRSTFTGVCNDLGSRYASATGHELDMQLHYALPHYHYLGNFFNLALTGGPLDGTDVFTVNGFDGQAHGGVFDPAIDMTGVEGLRFTCGYDNWRDVNVGWGLGDREMCVMLGLAESDVVLDISVTAATTAVGEFDGVLAFEGPCAILVVPKNPAQSMPTPAERAAPLEIPASGDQGIPPVPDCIDHDPSVQPQLEPTLANVFAAVFQPSCSFNACHGQSGQAAGLDLQAPDLLTELLGHEVLGNPGMNLVEPGDPDSSWLYQVLSSCTPDDGSGGTVSHMPLNAPVLLSDTSVALVREWIAAGAN